MRQKKLIALALTALLLTAGFSAMAAVGTSDNPLVTLSYLKDTFTQSILGQTQDKITDAQRTYEDKLDQKIQSASLGGGSSSGGAYQVVSLSNGQTLTGGVGCEVMLRVGSAVCIGNGSPGLIDTTIGGTLEAGQGLEKNHLYMVTIESQGVQALANAKVLVRGPYTIH